MTEKEIREKNLETIEAFLKCAGPERGIQRAPLFAPGGRKEMMLTIEGKTQFQDVPFEEWLSSTTDMFPNWGFYDNVIFETKDPNIYLVKSHGVGEMILDGVSHPYSNYYINEFRMEDGKIKLFRETINKCEDYSKN